MRIQTANSEFSLPDRKRTDECDMDHALFALQSFAVSQLNSEAAISAINRLNTIAKRYNIDTSKDGFIDKIPNQNDKDVAIANSKVIERSRAAMNWARDLENLRHLYRFSRERLTIMMNELPRLKSEQDLKRVGQAWATKMSSANELDKTLNLSLMIIEKLVPSDKEIEMKAQNRK